MDPEQVERLLSDITMVPNDQRGSIDKLLQYLREEVDQIIAKEPVRPGSESLNQGAPIEIGFAVAIEFVPSQESSFVAAQNAEAGALPLPFPLSKFPEGTWERLKDMDVALLEWMFDPKNAALFVVDPVGATERMAQEQGIELDQDLITLLHSIHKSPEARHSPIPGVRLDQLTATVNLEGKVEPGEGKEDVR